MKFIGPQDFPDYKKLRCKVDGLGKALKEVESHWDKKNDGLNTG